MERMQGERLKRGKQSRAPQRGTEESNAGQRGAERENQRMSMRERACNWSTLGDV